MATYSNRGLIRTRQAFSTVITGNQLVYTASGANLIYSVFSYKAIRATGTGTGASASIVITNPNAPIALSTLYVATSQTINLSAANTDFGLSFIEAANTTNLARAIRRACDINGNAIVPGADAFMGNFLIYPGESVYISINASGTDTANYEVHEFLT